MKPLLPSLCFLLIPLLVAEAADREIPNRLIDYPQFLKGAEAVKLLRHERRLTEEEFIKIAQDPATIVFDARSDEKFRLLHVKGAKHLSLPDITAEELAKIIPSKETRVLIYCNNNFENAPVAFARKRAPASLNIYTFNTLHTYGYTNVYELGPLLDIRTTKVPLEGTEAKRR
jgi:rhodanese-related sulfurtransferase